MTGTLPFLDESCQPSMAVEFCPGAMLLRGFALVTAGAIVDTLPALSAGSPFRHMVTKGGHRMSVAMTNCGAVGWISDRSGYRYDSLDPETGQTWPAMPAFFLDLAQRAAAAAGFDGFVPDICLINRYEPGTRLALHQDRDERAFEAPIVSVSLGAPAVFLFGGAARGDPVQRIPLAHGDVVVWGGPARLNFHGVASLKATPGPLLGQQRINLTFRRAG